MLQFSVISFINKILWSLLENAYLDVVAILFISFAVFNNKSCI